MTAKEISEKKIALRSRTQELMIFANKILVKREDYTQESEDMGCWGRRKHSKRITKDTKKLKIEYHKLEKELEVYDVENTLKANPLADCCKLILGINKSYISELYSV